MYRPNEKGVTGAHAAAPIWGLVMEQALKDSELENFPIPSEIRFEHASISDGHYESKMSDSTIKVALNKNNVLPRYSAPTVANKTSEKLEVVRLERKPTLPSREASRPIKVKHNSSNLDSKIWFMLNLENASMGQIHKIPTSWFVQMLKDTRDIKTNSPGRLIKGRKVLIEKLLSRVGSLENGMIEGVMGNALFRLREIKDYEIQSVTSE